MSLRQGILTFGGLLLLGALLLIHPTTAGAALTLAVYGLFIVGSILLERGRYRGPRSLQNGPWQRTGERFVDPTTGRLTEVYFNPRTGERTYLPITKLGISKNQDR